MEPIDDEVERYKERLQRRLSGRHEHSSLLLALVACVLSLGLLCGGGVVVDLGLASTYSADGRAGSAIQAHDLAAGWPLVGACLYAFVVIAAWVAWRHPRVQRRRAVRLAGRRRLAAEIGPKHPMQQWAVQHPYVVHLLSILVIFKLLELAFGPVTKKRL